uniref:Uncharacterized protein n=1 Tax=Oryza rufipogon TaxID=4529 RepID=A0A0E0Q7G0_ORYRU
MAPEARRCPALAVQWNRAAPGATVPPAGWPRCCGAAGGPPAGPAARILTSCSSAYFWIQQWRGGSHPREFFMGRRGSIAQGPHHNYFVRATHKTIENKNEVTIWVMSNACKNCRLIDGMIDARNWW